MPDSPPPSAAEFRDLIRRPLAELPRELAMVPLPGPFDVTIRPPGSKSLTNRALLLAALAEGESVIEGALIDADDARVMIEALRQLGAEITIEGGNDSWNPDRKGGGDSQPPAAHPVARAPGSMRSATVRIRGTAGRLRGNCTLNLKNAGTATRFLTAAACLADGPVIIDGNERMRQRPIGELVEMLRQLGVTIDELGAPGCVPLRVHPGTFESGTVTVGATQSSQYISALMLIAPFMKGGLRMRFMAPVTSPSYITLTEHLLRDVCGVQVTGEAREGGAMLIPPTIIRGFRCEVEPDASSATYFSAAEALCPKSRCRLPLDATSPQADARFPSAMQRIGGAVDLSLMPDASMTLAAVACFASGGTTTLTGLRTLRVKETDRLAALRTELSKLGVQVEIFQTPKMSESASESSGPPDEGLRITPPPSGIECRSSVPRIVFDTYDDHRMAMSLALIGLRRPNIVIRDPACVAKTYPTFWQHLSLLYTSAIEGGRHIDSADPIL